MRSRDFRYLLHCVGVQEKDQLMHDLWEQHTEEMKILTVCNKDCTVEFQPGADMSWQSWAAYELNQAAKYPSLMPMCIKVTCAPWVEVLVSVTMTP